MSAQTLRIDLHHILLRFPAQPAAGQVWRLAAPRRRSAPRARPAPLLHGCPELELLVGHERSWSGVKVTASRRWPTQPAHRELSQTSRPRPLVFFTPRKRGGGQMCIFAPRGCRWFILNKPLWANVPHTATGITEPPRCGASCTFILSLQRHGRKNSPLAVRWSLRNWRVSLAIVMFCWRNSSFSACSVRGWDCGVKG